MMCSKKLIILLIPFISIINMNAIAQEDFKVEKVDGVTIVSNPKKPIPRNGLKKRIVFKEELSIKRKKKRICQNKISQI